MDALYNLYIKLPYIFISEHIFFIINSIFNCLMTFGCIFVDVGYMLGTWGCILGTGGYILGTWGYI